MLEEELLGYKKWFEEYTDSFRVPGIAKDVEMKILHTKRVCREIVSLGERLGLDGAGLRLADAVALFHDVGRFPQVQRYKTFNDARSVNHAALGLEVMAEEGLLSRLEEEERRVIEIAVGLHNVLRVPAGLPEGGLFYTRLIRDADKLDIWRVVLDYYESGRQERDQNIELEVPDTPGFSPVILSDIMAGRVPEIRLVTNFNDAKLLQMSWSFDLNFGAACSVALERRYMERLAAQLPETDEVREVLIKVTSHLADMES